MRKLKNDLTGQTFGRLYVIGVADNGKRKTEYVCKCSCGNVKVIRADALQSGSTKSCGCLKKEQDAINLKKDLMEERHTESGQRLYDIWQAMKGRCYSKNNTRYHRYGARGIIVCEEWKNDFVAFYNWALNNGYADDKTIERKDNDKGYNPNNCRWATLKEQANNRRTNIKITIGNATKNLSEWCEIFNLDYSKVHARYSRGDCTLDDLFRE